MQKTDVIKHILRNSNHGSFVNAGGGSAWAPSNIALVKYWGKRDQELNLPVTSSLSVSLGDKGAFTKIKQEGDADKYVLNGAVVGPDTSFAKRLQEFLDLFRPTGAHYLVETDTTVPIAAGFASSACGFAALVQALNNLYDWQLSKKDLSILARLGSGSACRSIYDGFVEWQCGEDHNGMDSYGMELEYVWPELRVGLLSISHEEKTISSREAMQRTVETSAAYSSWPKQVAVDLEHIKLALAHKDFELLGEVAENNSNAMHIVMKNAELPISYSLADTLEAMERVEQLRLAGVPVYYTQDAGPNLQLLFLAENEEEVLRAFPELEVVIPFAESSIKQVTLVDESDVEIGASEKLAAHVQGKLHRAFSVLILRERNGEVETLLQQRSSSKYHSANLWTNACCGHPLPGENIIAAAEKRLREEMGFSVPLKEIGQFQYRAELSGSGLIENEYDHVLVGYSDLEEFPVNPEEVQDCCWVELNDLLQDLRDNSEKYTAWLPYVAKIGFEKI